ncbi:TPR-like protein [Periconia macrospinosa]|uniref:TPR-like protein n=1 Tax=Periconia macrospinosa TaxID=97972 RepID=A0A2V1DSB4_9PLEO|nr:TPR-like protein [Periconia macrospinosa]
MLGPSVARRVGRAGRGGVCGERARLALATNGSHRKSQLAIEHCYRVREASPETWVFWVHASNEARFEHSYRGIANCIKVPGRQDPKRDIFQLVHDWLYDERKGRWLLILDNVDDANFLLKTPSAGRNRETEGKRWQPLINFVPQCQHGSVLITTRSRIAARGLVDERDIISVEPMEMSYALLLLQKKVGPQEKSEDVVELAAELECMPLAMVQAAAYIVQRRPYYSVQQYLVKFRKSDYKKIALFDNKDIQVREELRRDSEAENSIITTLQITFDYIRETRPSAGDLLALASFFDRQGIHEELLRVKQGQHERSSNSVQVWEDKDSSSQSSADDSRFEDAIQMLRAFSLISVDMDGVNFEMHGLVQLAIQHWLKKNDQLGTWQKESLRIIAKSFPGGEHETWTKCQTLLPHAKKVLSYKPGEDKEATQHQATIASKTAWYLLHIGEYKASVSMGRRAMTEWEKIREPGHKDILKSMWQLGSAFTRQEKHEEAEVLHRRSVEITQAVLGPEHCDTLISLSYFASALERRGKVELAESIHREVLQTRTGILGPEHPHTLLSFSLLAQALSGQGQYEEAEELHRRALEGREKIWGPQNQRTLDSTSFLSIVLSNRQKYEEAEVMSRRALEGREKALEKEHPDTLTSVYCLAYLLHHRHRYEEAILLYQRASSGYTTTLGLNHPRTQACLNNQLSLERLLHRQASGDPSHEPRHEVVDDSTDQPYPGPLEVRLPGAELLPKESWWRKFKKKVHKA